MTTITTQTGRQVDRKNWLRLGLIATAASVVAVLIIQFLALAIWPDIALFKPLDSYARTAVFTAVPAIGATILLAWLAARKPDPLKTFIRISIVVLIISIIPDYLLPVPNKTLLASTVTAFMHVVAAIVIVGVLVSGYRRTSGSA
jgi:hypothetical protein